MGKIDLTETTHDRLRLLAAAWGKDEEGAVAELIRRLGGDRPVTKPTPEGEVVPIHFEYRGTRVEGEYSRKSQRVTITSGSLAGTTYPKPSPAARAVVGSVAPEVNPHRNGWAHWIVTETGEPLQSIRRS